MSLGVGFSPILKGDGRVAMLRGRSFGYGYEFDCTNKSAKNWVSVYDPTTQAEEVLFDRPIPIDGGAVGFCVFDQMQMSPDGSTLYLVMPAYATSGNLAIIGLRHGEISYVPGVMSVFVIEGGAHQGELIYSRRVAYASRTKYEPYYHYPFIHSRANGKEIREISDEFFTVNGGTPAPILKSYLRQMGGRIVVNGKPLP